MGKIRFRLLVLGCLLILLAGLGLATDDPAKTETKIPAKTTDKAADATKTGAKDTAKAAEKAADATAKGVLEAGKATEKAATTAAKGTAKAAEKAADATAKGAKETGKATEKAATTAAKGTATAAEKVADATAKRVLEAGKAAGRVIVPGEEDMLDINSAPEEMLRQLPGIGSDYAAKIIAGRPYANKTDLKSRGILPDSVYNKIAGFITARQK